MSAESTTDAVRRGLELAILFVVASYFALFLYWNSNAASVSLSPWHGLEVSLPAVLVVAIGFLVGFAVAALLATVGSLARSGEIRAARRRAADLEAELSRLRNLPLDEDLHRPAELDVVVSEPDDQP
ncbi:MAG: LapA family protein [Acidobacteriota bacterium]